MRIQLVNQSKIAGFKSITVQSTMEVDLVAADTAMKESLFCSDMMVELGFKEGFESVPAYINNISALHVEGNKAFSPRFFFSNSS